MQYTILDATHSTYSEYENLRLGRDSELIKNKYDSRL